jgi:hypothetical protein
MASNRRKIPGRDGWGSLPEVLSGTVIDGGKRNGIQLSGGSKKKEMYHSMVIGVFGEALFLFLFFFLEESFRSSLLHSKIHDTSISTVKETR